MWPVVVILVNTTLYSKIRNLDFYGTISGFLYGWNSASRLPYPRNWGWVFRFF